MERHAGQLLKWITRAELVVACSGLAMAALALCVDVIAREVLNSGIYGVQKFAVYCCAIAGALGLSIVVQGGGHLRITAVDALIPRSQMHWVARLGDLVSAAAFLFLAWYAVKFVRSTYAFGETDVVLQIPIWRVQLVLPLAFGLAALKFLLHALLPGTRPPESTDL